MNPVVIETFVILLLLAANGLFAMTEIAVVSARKARLRGLADAGDARARAALSLIESPNRFLATVQVGITLVGVLAGAFGGATLADEIARHLQAFPRLAHFGEAIGIGTVVLGITFLSLILGELVPKRIGLNNPEGIARIMAGPMNRLARLASPVVRLLSASTELVLWLIRLKKPQDPAVTEDEVKMLIQEGVQAGVFGPHEPEMVESVLALDRLPVRRIMTPRAGLIWIKQSDPHEAIWHKIVVSGHSQFPVYESTRDRVVGMISLKAIYANLAAGIPINVRDLVVSPLCVPDSETAAGLLEKFKKTGKRVALVTGPDEKLIGLVTLIDVMEAIVGEFPLPAERIKPQARLLNDGSWLVDGAMALEELGLVLPRLEFPPADTRDYSTMGGFVAALAARSVKEGEAFEAQGLRFEALDMDDTRIDKVLITPLDSGSPLLNARGQQLPPSPPAGGDSNPGSAPPR
jgi:putative hemolysin